MKERLKSLIHIANDTGVTANLILIGRRSFKDLAKECDPTELEVGRDVKFRGIRLAEVNEPDYLSVAVEFK